MIANIPTSGLSIREREILRHVSRGEKNAEIALQLGISVQTVKNHLTNIFDKLDLEKRSRKRAVRLALGPTHLVPAADQSRRPVAATGGPVYAHA